MPHCSLPMIFKSGKRGEWLFMCICISNLTQHFCRMVKQWWGGFRQSLPDMRPLPALGACGVGSSTGLQSPEASLGPTAGAFAQETGEGRAWGWLSQVKKSDI